MLRHVQVFDQAVIKTAKQKEQNLLLERVTQIAQTDAPAYANVINSHNIYKVNVNDDQYLMD